MYSRILYAVIVMTAQEVENQLKEEYSKKLDLEYCTFLDPFKLDTGWVEEEDEIAHWSIILVICILNFLIIKSDIMNSSDCKASKGYIFFK